MNSTIASPMGIPKLPRLLSMPMRLVPSRAHSIALTRILNQVFARELSDGEWDFLEGQVMLIEVDDAGMRLRLTLEGDRLVAARPGKHHDLSISGNIYEFLLLATRREDPDTLFFNRRLRLGGSTELGLYVKNLLDAWEPTPRLEPFLKALDHATTVYERLGQLRLRLPF